LSRVNSVARPTIGGVSPAAVVTTGARRPEDRRESFAHRSASAAQRPGRACFVLPMRPFGDN
jgi:hypothetical protein